MWWGVRGWAGIWWNGFRPNPENRVEERRIGWRLREEEERGFDTAVMDSHTNTALALRQFTGWWGRRVCCPRSTAVRCRTAGVLMLGVFVAGAVGSLASVAKTSQTRVAKFLVRKLFVHLGFRVPRIWQLGFKKREKDEGQQITGDTCHATGTHILWL